MTQLSLKSVLIKRAEQIATSQPDRYDSWQHVIRTAIWEGLPLISSGKPISTATAPPRKRKHTLGSGGDTGGKSKRLGCPMRDNKPTNCPHGCRECRDASKPLYDNIGRLLDRGLTKE